MAAKNFGSRVNDLLQNRQWDEARQVLEQEHERNPTDHWVLTQLGVTFYEQDRYEEALQVFLRSLRVLEDCPLTLWNLAGALDALGYHGGAIRVYTWLLQSNRSPKDDPCWESKQWTDSLKADCVYRLGACFQHLGKKDQAEHCYRQYLNLLATGIEGQYAFDSVINRIRSLQGSSRRRSTGGKLKEIVEATLGFPGIERNGGSAETPPKFDEKELLVVGA